MPAKNNEPKQAEDPFNRINTALLRRGKISKVVVSEIPWHAFSTEPFEKKRARDKEKKRRPEKIHPVLKGWIARRARDETELVMINFHDHLKIPRFPEPNTDEPRL